MLVRSVLNTPTLVALRPTSVMAPDELSRTSSRSGNWLFVGTRV